MALVDLGIDPRVADLLSKDGITSLYPPQGEAWHEVRAGKNAVVAIPTASGKSLIAYLAILHRLLGVGGKALYIVPLRALASEKHRELQGFKGLGFKVGLATGDLDEADVRLGQFDIIICTSEKADALLRHRTGWVEAVTCVVADEMHLIHDAGRGPTLEVLLARFRAVVPKAQIVGLSATIQNAAELAQWLDARLVTSTWRPVELRRGTWCDDELRFEDGPARELRGLGDPVTSLCEETLKDGGQCLVFVSTRRSAEAQASKLAGPIRDLLSAAELAALDDVASGLGDEETGPLAKKLAKLVRAGVAFHTAGLDAHQRRTLEDAFRARTLKVLTATPTLAAGVNTPARRVIIRDLTRFEVGLGARPLPIMEVHQMMGRAGRPRYDPVGEAVLIAKDEGMRDALVTEYLHGEPEPVSSKLGADAALRIHCLASLAGGYAATMDDLHRFFASTLWARQVEDWVVRDRLEDVLWFLEENGFVERDGGRLVVTPFGKRTSDLYIDPLSALRLRAALEADAPLTDFAALQAVCGCPDVFPLYLRKGDDWVQARFFDHHEELLVPEDGRDLESAMAYAKTAFLLLDWMDEMSQETLEERYQVGPGDIRMRQDSAAWLLHALEELARALRPDAQRDLMRLSMRLESGIRADLLPLVSLKGIGRRRARTLYNAGFKRPADLRGAMERIARLPGFGRTLAEDLDRQVGGARQATLEAP